MQEKPCFQSVLLIDDSDIDSWLADLLIRNVKFAKKVLKFKNGGDALSYLLRAGSDEVQKIPEFIFLDLRMPELNGMDFLRRCQQLEMYKIPVCVLTASILESDRKQAMAMASVKHFIVKPLTHQSLVELKEFYPSFT